MGSMSNVYVLMEEGWEYNDETYFHPDSGSGTPTKVFGTQEAADVECNRRNLESLKKMFAEGDASQYFYNLTNIIIYSSRKDSDKVERLEELIQIIFGCDIDQLNDQLDYQRKIEANPDVSDTTWLEFQSMTTLNFWTVVECEKE
jgi:hypothetical protein